jgi:hypothetical protein
MKISVFGIMLMTLAHSFNGSITRVENDPNVLEGSYLMDNRDVNKSLMTRNDIEPVVTESNRIDLSPSAASNMFRQLHSMNVVEGERNMRMKYILHQNIGNDQGSNRFLEEWSMVNNNDGFYSVVVRMRMLDLNNLSDDDGITESMLSFTCKHYSEQDVYVCLPDKCDFHGVVPPATPVQICVNNYRQSQILLDTVKTATSTQEPKTLGDDTQLLIVLCMEKYIETITVQGENICYYEGFKPENMVTYEQLKENITKSGEWVETEKAGSFQRTTIVKEWEVVSKIDTSVPILKEQHTTVLRDVDPATLATIQEQLNAKELNMDTAIKIATSNP